MERVALAIVYSAIFGILCNFAAAQNLHFVGDSMGWRIPPNASVSYSNWASGKTFLVGDILVFNFLTNEHDVVQVPVASYNDCSDDNEIGSVITTGPANITLTSPGDHYYICTIGSHCEAGQKLSITVSDPNSPTPPPTTTPSPPPPATTTPSPATPQPDACAPTPEINAPGPGSNTPTASTTPSPPAAPDSASVSLSASFLLLVLPAALAFLY